MVIEAEGSQRTQQPETQDGSGRIGSDQIEGYQKGKETGAAAGGSDASCRCGRGQQRGYRRRR